MFKSDARHLSVLRESELLLHGFKARSLGLLKQNEEVFGTGPDSLLAILSVSLHDLGPRASMSCHLKRQVESTCCEI